jgi:hypothetical protein
VEETFCKPLAFWAEDQSDLVNTLLDNPRTKHEVNLVPGEPLFDMEHECAVSLTACWLTTRKDASAVADDCNAYFGTQRWWHRSHREKFAARFEK